MLQKEGAGINDDDELGFPTNLSYVLLRKNTSNLLTHFETYILCHPIYTLCKKRLITVTQKERKELVTVIVFVQLLTSFTVT